MKEFTVKRSSWLRGEGSKNSALLRDDGKQCCLGFIAEQCGVDRSRLTRTYPSRLEFSDQKLLPECFYEVENDIISDIKDDSQLVRSAASINDDSSIEDVERERNLVKLFLKHDITLKFVD